MIKTAHSFMPYYYITRIRKTAKSDCFVVSVCASVRMELGYHWTDFHKVYIWVCVFRKPVEKIQVSLKPDKNNGYFTWKSIYIYDSIVLNS
jgi:hypothetical protein